MAMTELEKAQYEQKLLAKYSSTYGSLVQRIGTVGGGVSPGSDLLLRSSSGYGLMQNRVDPTGEPDPNPSSVDGVNDLAHLLHNQGGLTQQERMIRDKRRTLDRAVLYSYQGAIVEKVEEETDEDDEDELTEVTDETEEENENKLIRALINPNKVKQDYDDKIISIGYESKFTVGDVFQWVGTKTYWLIYLQDLTELAYFRGNIRKCSYQIKYIDENGKTVSTYAAVQGPTETRIDTIQKYGTGYDNPNYSLTILIPKTTANLKYFVRYARFYLPNGVNNTCWRIEGVDAYSTPGIIQFTAVEYYSNLTTDDISEGIAKEAIATTINTTSTTTDIVGDILIKPSLEYDYYFNDDYEDDDKWFVTETKLPVNIIQVYTGNDNKPHIKIKWTSSYSGKFKLYYGTATKYSSLEITVESLF